MYKEAWGLKRICPMCSKQYYDLGRTELECPECGKEIEVTTMSKPRRGRKPGSTNAAPLVNPVPQKAKEKEDELDIENLDLDNPYVFVVGSYNSSAGNQELIDAYMGWNVKPGVDNGVMWYGGATTHYIGSGSDVQVWAAYKNIADFAVANGPEGVRNSEYAGSFWNLVEGSHSDQIYVHVGNTRNAQGKFNRAGNDN